MVALIKEACSSVAAVMVGALSGLAVLAMIVLALQGCESPYEPPSSAGPPKYRIRQWSGGKIVGQWDATKDWRSSGDRVRFRESETGRDYLVVGEFTIEEIRGKPVNRPSQFMPPLGPPPGFEDQTGPLVEK